MGELFAKSEPFEKFPLLDRPELIAALSNIKKDKKAVIEMEIEGKEYMLAYAPVEGMDWLVGAVIPRPNVELYAQKNRRQVEDLTEERIHALQADLGRESMLVVLLVLLLAGLSTYSSLTIAGRFVKPLLELRNGLQAISKGNLDYKIRLSTNDEIEEVADAVNAMAVDLKKYIENISRITAEKQRIATEISVAHNIQVGALPRDFMTDRHDFQIYATMDAAKGVGGDFYDFYMTDENHLVVTIADVSGKGVLAALFMMCAKTTLKNLVLMAGNPDDFGAVMTLANRELCRDNETMMFVTVFIAQLDLVTGELVYVSAGHNAPCLRENGKFHYLAQNNNLVLGVEEDVMYEAHRFTLRSDDMLFLYTDGVTEAMDKEKNLYSEKRLEETLNNIDGSLSVEEILAEVRKDIEVYAEGAEQSDDITMLGVRFLGKKGVL